MSYGFAEGEMTVFNCSIAVFSHANVQLSALYLKSNGYMQYSGGLEEWRTTFPPGFCLNESVGREL